VVLGVAGWVQEVERRGPMQWLLLLGRYWQAGRRARQRQVAAVGLWWVDLELLLVRQAGALGVLLVVLEGQGVACYL
jgi:hypothetical protein